MDLTQVQDYATTAQDVAELEGWHCRTTPVVEDDYYVIEIVLGHGAFYYEVWLPACGPRLFYIFDEDGYELGAEDSLYNAMTLLLADANALTMDKE